MKTIEMTGTVAQENASGVNQVFGPAGKQFTLDDTTADTLIKKGAAKVVGVESRIVEPPVEE